MWFLKATALGGFTMSITMINGKQHATTVTAAEIRTRLMLASSDRDFEPAVVIEEANVPDAIDFANLHCNVALVMRGCRFEQPVNLAGAKFPALALTDGCHAPSINAEHIVVEGDVDFDRLVCEQVNLAGAHISDDLHVEGAQISAGAPALDAANSRIGGAFLGERLIANGLRLEGAEVGCKINLDDACLTVGDGPPDREALTADALVAKGGIEANRLKANGQVRLIDVKCASTLELSGAQLTCETPDKIALGLDRSQIAGSLYCDKGFTAVGVVHAIGVDIGGSLYLDGSHLTNATPDGESLILRHTRIHVQLSATASDEGRFTADGRIDLSDARIDGNMQVTGADLVAHNGPTLTADRAFVGAGLTFRDITANGTIRLNSTHVVCDLNVADLSFESSGASVALELNSATIDGKLHLHADSTEDSMKGIHGDVDLGRAKIGILRIAGEPPTGTTDLTGAHASVLLDEPHRYFDDEHRLVLNGFTYDQIHMSGVPLKHRLDWLEVGTRKVRAGTDGYHAPSHGFVPQPYEQLAAVYRGLGQMRDARIILLHKNRARTRGANWRTRWPWRILGYIQDVFVGYGYAPGRAFAWILALLFTGVGYFATNNPVPTEGTASFTGIDTVRYPMDLLLPGIGVGGKSVWTPADGFGKTLALTLIIAGWLLGITIAAGITRALRRD